MTDVGVRSATEGTALHGPTTAGWRPYEPAAGRASTVVGNLRILPGFPGPPGGPARDLLVHLPASAGESGRRYPVLYMHDGQNLFDDATSFSGEWRVDETLVALASEGLELIVVGIPNAGDRRVAEYTPYQGRYGLRRRRFGGQGAAYVDWLVSSVRPAIDGAFPTDPRREATGIMGSSLGGLISLWAAAAHPETFGLVGAMSPAVIDGQRPIIERLRRLDPRPRLLYIDAGGREGSTARWGWQRRRQSAQFVADARELRRALVDTGLSEGTDLRYVEDNAAIHHEAAWARRLPDALRFLFGAPGTRVRQNAAEDRATDPYTRG